MSVAERWYLASLAGALALIGGSKLGGIRLMVPAGPVRKIWLEEFRKLMPDDAPPVYVPASVSARALIGGVSMAKSLASGALTKEAGLIEQARGRALIVSMADRLDGEAAALIGAGMDQSDVGLEAPSNIVLLDESDTPEEAPPYLLTERVAFEVDLFAVPYRFAEPFVLNREDIRSARERVSGVHIDDAFIEAVVAACISVGALSMRTPIFCVEAAKAIAALGDRTEVSAEDTATACRLIVPARMESMPQEAPDDEPPTENKEPPEESDAEANSDEETASLEDLEAMLIDAVAAEAGASFARKKKRRADRKARGIAGRSGDVTFAMDKGRPDRTLDRQTEKGRVDLIATLRTAAPMQTLRRKKTDAAGFAIRKSDLRMKRFRRRKQSSVIFVVDASGSSALNRLAEAKGAATRLLTDCYARRDLVSLIVFRGKEAELALSPTRSLVRVKRQLADLPGGGATPLADAMATAVRLADAENDRGRTPVIVFLSDGRGNITLDGTADRGTAEQQTKLLARTLAMKQLDTLFFDTSRRPDPRAQALSTDMGAAYHFLPARGGSEVSDTVRNQIGRR
ncbi:MAG: VWA domain-containing protein [Pseudomonadota bacterium]